jgi:hypothetical protein
MHPDLAKLMLRVAKAWLTLLTVGLTACVGAHGGPARVATTGGDSTSNVLGSAASGIGQGINGAVDKSAKIAVTVLDAGPAPDAGFLLQPGRMVERDRSQHPFQRVWVAEHHDRDRYSKIIVAPVEIEHLLEGSWWDKMSTATFFGLHDDAERLSGRLQGIVEQAFSDDPNHRFEVTDQPDAQTVILELALVEIVPNKSVMALAALASFGGGPAVSSPINLVASRAEHGFFAFEGRLRDGATGQVIAMFSDRETAKTRVLDLQSVMWYGHANDIFDEWAEQLVAVTNRPRDPGIPDPTPFSLRPW